MQAPNPIAFTIAGIDIRWYGILIGVAFLLAIYISYLRAPKFGIVQDDILDLTIFLIPCSIIGARAYYVIFSYDNYRGNFIQMLNLRAGGLAIHGGIIGAFIGACYYAKKNKMNLWVLTDMAVGPLLFGQFLGRFGNLANGEVHGVPTFTPLSIIFSGKFNEWWIKYQSMSTTAQAQFKQLVPWGLVFPLNTPAGSEFPNLPLHPAMLYEAFLNLIGFTILWFYFRKKEYNPGVLSMIYLIMYAIIRTFVSTFRAEDLLIFGIRLPYLISIVMIVVAIIGIKFFSNPERKFVPAKNEEKQ